MARKKARVAARKPKLSAAPNTKNHTEGFMPSSQSIGFLDLPIEVRVTIYKLRFTGATLFINDDGIDLERSRARGEIARASKEIYSESMPILYGLTTLVYHGATRGPAQLYLIPQYQKYIPRLVLMMEKPATLTHRNLKGYKALQVLRLDVGKLEIDMTRDSPWNLLKIRSSIQRNAVLVLGMIEAIEGWHRRAMYVYQEQKGPIKLNHLTEIVSSKGRTYDLEVAADLDCQFEHGDVLLSVVVDWVTKTIKSKKLSGRDQQEESAGQDDEGDDDSDEETVDGIDNGTADNENDGDTDEGSDNLFDESSPLGLW